MSICRVYLLDDAHGLAHLPILNQSPGIWLVRGNYSGGTERGDVRQVGKRSDEPLIRSRDSG